MTVSNPVNRWSYAGTGVQTIFQYLARIYEASDLVVYLRDAAGVEILQVLNVDYSVDGVLVEDGGNVTFGTAPAAGQTVIIKIVLPFTQELALPEAGLLPTGPMEIALDRLVKLNLQLKEQVARALQFSEGSPSQDKVFPEPEAGKYLIWGADGALANTVLLSLTDALAVIAAVETYFSDPDNFPGGQDAAKIADGSVSNAEFQCLNGIISNIQAQLNTIAEAAIQPPVAILQNRQNSGVAGGTATSGSWLIVPFNVEYEDAAAIVDSTALPAFSLAPGTYRIEANVTFRGTNLSQLRLYQVTAPAGVVQNINAKDIYGESTIVVDSYGDNKTLFLEGTFIIAGTKQLRLEYRVQTTCATNGFGVPASFAEEVYAQLKITKIA
jgi:hypothetical protein